MTRLMAFGDNYNPMACSTRRHATSWTVPPRRAPLHTPRPRICCGNFSGNDDSTHLWTNRTFHTIFYPKQPKIQLVFELFPLTLAAEYVIIITANYLRCALPHRIYGEEKAMKEFTYTIKEPVGIHARPAGMLAKEAKTCQSTVTIVDKNGKVR